MSDRSNKNSGSTSSNNGCPNCDTWCTCSKFNAKTSFSLSTTTSLTPKTETIKKEDRNKTEKED